MRGWNRVWVGITTTLISFISFTSQIFVIWPWYGNILSVDLIKLLAPFNFLVFMVFWNYRLCVITPPGGVPYGWRPNLSSLEGMEVKRGSHAPRYCKTCQHYKPPRTHHCRQCNTCVLDHHCPWVANCVGYHNQGHFLRFLVWVDLATAYHLGMIFFRVRDFVLHPWPEPTLMEMLFMIFNFATCGPVFICVGCFSIYHLYLAAGNSTTIERWEKDKVATLVRRGKIKEIKYPYHIGTVNNLKAVLGDSPALWAWPKPMKGDGLSFPVNPAVEPGAQFLWPPADPTRLADPVRPGNRASSASAFIYGDGLNPNLVPTSSGSRSYPHPNSQSQPHSNEGDYTAPQTHPYPPYLAQASQAYPTGEDTDFQPTTRRRRENVSPWQVEVNSDGEALDSDRSESYSSSPEPYLSDYDYDDDGVGGAENEGRAASGFSDGGEAYDDGAVGDGMERPRLRQGSEGLEVAWAERPWEQPGRYNVY